MSHRRFRIVGEPRTAEIKKLFRGIGRRKMKSRLEPFFVEDQNISISGGRVFVPREQVTFRDLLASFLPEIQTATHLTEEAIFREHRADDIFECLISQRTVLLLTCSNHLSLISRTWGIRQLSVGRRGYFYHENDTDWMKPLGFLSAWEPVRSKEAFTACFVRTYCELASKDYMPPNEVGYADGPPTLMLPALSAYLRRSPGMWENLIELGAELLESKLRDFDDDDLKKVQEQFGEELFSEILPELTRKFSDHLEKVRIHYRIRGPDFDRILRLLKYDPPRLLSLVRQPEAREIRRVLIILYWVLVSPETYHFKDPPWTFPPGRSWAECMAESSGVPS